MHRLRDSSLPLALLACVLAVGCTGTVSGPAETSGDSQAAPFAAEAAAADAAMPPDAAGDPVVDAAGGIQYAAMPPNACERTQQGASAFLNHFVRFPESRESHTDSRAIEAGVDPEDFGIASVDNRWAYADPSLESMDYPRIALDVSVEGDRFDVDYTKARFSSDEETVEPYGPAGRYSFEFIDGCWKLVGGTPLAGGDGS